MTSLSPAQERALEWLPSDGGWRKFDVAMAEDIGSLLREQTYLIELDWAAATARATPAGIALKAEIFP